MDDTASTLDPILAARVAELEALVAAQRAALEEERAAREAEQAAHLATKAERDQLRDAYDALAGRVSIVV